MKKAGNRGNFLKIGIGIIIIGVSAWIRSAGYSQGLAGVIFGCGVTLFFSIPFFLPKLAQPEPSEQAMQNFKKVYDDNGIFKFLDTGFSVLGGIDPQIIQWSEIISMVGYKEDNLTTDNICLDVFCDGGKSFKITEETAGWFMFLEHSKEAFPSIDKSWEFEITVPAFETKTTLIYDRNNRTLKEVASEFYKT